MAIQLVDGKLVSGPDSSESPTEAELDKLAEELESDAKASDEVEKVTEETSDATKSDETNKSDSEVTKETKEPEVLVELTEKQKLQQQVLDILKEHGMMESDIAINSEYWALMNRLRVMK